MTRRYVNPGITILVALALFLAVTASPIRQALGCSGVGRCKPSRAGVASKVVQHDRDARPEHSLKVGLFDPSEIRDDTDGDAKVESSLGLPSTAPFSEFFTSTRFGAVREASRLVAAASRPLRC